MSALGLGLLSAASFRRLCERTGSGRVVVKGRNYETNIKRKKGPAEMKQAKVTAKHLRFVMIALREGGSADPDVNRQLNRAIKAAMKDNVPRDTIDKRIKSVLEKGSAMEEMTIEGYGPGGTALIVQTMTDNVPRCRMEVKEVFKDCGFEVGTPGCVATFFKHQGILRFEDADEEKVLEASMEAEADVEDIVTREDGIVEAITAPEDLSAVTAAFESVGMDPASAEAVMKPEVEKNLDQRQTYDVMRMVYMLDDLDDVGEVHTNAVYEDGVELKFSAYNQPLSWETAQKY